jgi:hypothetical protein
MRRVLVIALTAALSIAASASATTPSPEISGVVRNTTCPGPCVSRRTHPAPLYTGDGLIVKIRNRMTHQVIARLQPTDGTFAVDAGPGAYHVRALIREPQESPDCWRGSAKNVGIVDQAAWVRLTVRNRCIV